MLARPLAAFLGGLAVLASQAGAQQVHVVAPFGTPGVLFHIVQPAVDAAADGDVILILPGSYENEVVVENRSLVLAGVPGPTGQRPLLHSFVVRGIAAEDSVVIRGLRFSPQVVGEGLAVDDCAGAVLFEDCVVDEVILSAPPRVRDSHRVMFTLSTLCGPAGISTATSLIPGRTGLEVTRATVTLADSQVTGGTGAPGGFLFGTEMPSSAGGPGVVVTQGTLFAAGSTIRGGAGGAGGQEHLGPGCTPPSAGGDGLILDGLLRQLEAAIAAGPGGQPGNCGLEPGAPGTDVVFLGGEVETLPQTLRTLAISSPVEPGAVVSIDIAAMPFEPLLLLQSFVPLAQWHGGLKGTLAGAPPYVLFALGNAGADGTLHLAVTLPLNVLPASLPSLLVIDQLVTPASGGGGLLSSPSALVLVNDLP